MKIRSLLTLILITATFSSAIAQAFLKAVVSPDHRIQATLMINEKGSIIYKARYQGKYLVGQSQLGLQLRGYDLTTGLKWIGHGTSAHNLSEHGMMGNSWSNITMKS